MKIVRSSQEIYGMSRVGTISNKGTTYEIYVNTDDEVKLPHFHFRDMNDWDNFHTCIRIDVAEYFHHGNKQDTLNSHQKKLLNDFMCTPTVKVRFDEHGNRLNNWQYICDMWDANNSDVIIPEDIIQPDYTKL